MQTLPWISADNPPKENGFYIVWIDKGQGLIHYHKETGWQNGFYNGLVTYYLIITPPKKETIMDKVKEAWEAYRKTIDDMSEGKPEDAKGLNESLLKATKLMQDTNDLLRSYPKREQGKEAREERFKMPTDKQVVDFAVVFNDGKIEQKKLADMVGFLTMVMDRLYENGDILEPSSKENNENEKQETKEK